jgi:hypothetical protein
MKSGAETANLRLWKSINYTAFPGYGWGTASLAGALHPAISFGRKRPFATRRWNFTSVTDKGTHSSIS